VQRMIADAAGACLVRACVRACGWVCGRVHCQSRARALPVVCVCNVSRMCTASRMHVHCLSRQKHVSHGRADFCAVQLCRHCAVLCSCAGHGKSPGLHGADPCGCDPHGPLLGRRLLWVKLPASAGSAHALPRTGGDRWPRT